MASKFKTKSIIVVVSLSCLNCYLIINVSFQNINKNVWFINHDWSVKYFLETPSMHPSTDLLLKIAFSLKKYQNDRKCPLILYPINHLKKIRNKLNNLIFDLRG